LTHISGKNFAMKSLSKRLSQFAAITCIGLAGSAVAVFAQTPGLVKPGPVATNGPVAPPPFKCAADEVAFKDGNGTDDHFAGTVDPKPHPGNIPGLGVTNIYDQTASNYHFGDTFMLKQTGGSITKFRVTTRVKSNSTDSINDGFSFSIQPNFTPGHFSYGFAQGAGPIGWGDLTFVFDRATVNKIMVNTTFVDPAPFNIYNSNTFFNGLDSGAPLHFYVQDDTSVDYIQIEGCYKPAPKYDLVASKKHDGNVYLLNVHNAGSQIMPTGHVDVVEVVPAGLTITSFPGLPWTCTGVLNVVGPDSFTCSYQIPSGGIPANSNLPPIVLKSEGTAECPNCMRVKLYLKEFEGGVKPVNEGDMKNNFSCVK
jgi:hypothetical protein